ncbi:MAG: S-methyl-5-thioribose-1-phosphate isomerase [Myxococcota bacterium]
MKIDGTHHRTVTMRDDKVILIDQPRLPHTFGFYECTDVESTARAIETMIVRGAGAIGATAAFGMAQAALQASDAQFFEQVTHAANRLSRTRPTAQNLFFGIQHVLAAIEAERDDPAKARAAARAAAQDVADDDAESCKTIGRHGAPLFASGMAIATHCNAGWLAFVDWGSALSPIYTAHREGKNISVWVDETRPRSQGARLTAFELGQEGVPHQVIADNALGHLMQRGQVHAMIVGADRIAANGDVANKIGTYTQATLAAAHNIPFYVAAPTTTIDMACDTGASIPIEERSEDEVAYAWGWSDEGRFERVRLTPSTSSCYNPAFDVTPAHLIRAIITERGVVAPTTEKMRTIAR